jgi:Putative Actinobacterial Holin-X, holin superfamily III
VPEPDDKVVADPVAEEERPPEEDGDAEDAEDAESDDVDEIEAQASELLEQVGRDASVLVLREVELTTSRHIPELRRAARDISVVVGVGLAFATAFVLVNWAIVYALSSPLPSWRAPLVLAAVWAAIGLLLVVFVLHRTGQVVGWRWWKAMGADPEETVRGREDARDDAQHTLRESLQQFAGAVAREAGVLVTAAVVPIAGGAADAGEKVLDAVDDVTDVIEEKLPGGGVINRVADLALKPGRYALGAVNKGLKRDEPGSG